MEYKDAVLVRKQKKDVLSIDSDYLDRDVLANYVFDLRELGDFRGSGWYLSRACDWVIVRDMLGGLVLVPLKKKT